MCQVINFLFYHSTKGIFRDMRKNGEVEVKTKKSWKSYPWIYHTKVCVFMIIGVTLPFKIRWNVLRGIKSTSVSTFEEGDALRMQALIIAYTEELLIDLCASPTNSNMAYNIVVPRFLPLSS